jgi:hypothetical protein
VTRTATRVIAALTAATGGLCIGLGLAWDVPKAAAWGGLLALAAMLSVLELDA